MPPSKKAASKPKAAPRASRGATHTKTRSVTNTKLVTATIALLAAGGLAFAAIPSGPYLNEDGAKCGVNSFAVQQKCKGGYSVAQVSCHDGSTFLVGGDGGCYSVTYLHKKANSGCFGRCAAPPQDANVCTDSDLRDPQNLESSNIFEQGTVEANAGVFTDRCLDGQRLQEQYCSGRGGGASASSTVHICEFGCDNGACREQPAEILPILDVSITTATHGAWITTPREPVNVGMWLFTARDATAVMREVSFRLAALSSDVSGLNAERSIPRISRIRLLINDQVVDESTPDHRGSVTFEGFEHRISANDTARLTMDVSFNPILDETQTQTPIQFAFDRVEAISEDTGADVPEANIRMSGQLPVNPSVVIFKTVPTVSAVPLNNDILFNGVLDLYSFSVQAAPTGQISWGQVVLDIGGSCQGSGRNPIVNCIPPEGIRVYDQANNEIPATVTAIEQGGAWMDLVIRPEAVQTVAAGASRTYRIEADVDGFFEGDNVLVRMHAGASRHELANSLDEQYATFDRESWRIGNFIWSDNSGSYQSRDDHHWFGAYEVNGFSTRGQHFARPN